MRQKGKGNNSNEDHGNIPRGVYDKTSQITPTLFGLYRIVIPTFNLFMLCKLAIKRYVAVMMGFGTKKHNPERHFLVQCFFFYATITYLKFFAEKF